MRIHLDNINFESRTGPNSFAKKLAHELIKRGHTTGHEHPHVQLSFGRTNERRAPVVLRMGLPCLDADQDWRRLNDPIKRAYDAADVVVFQSAFSKNVCSKYLGQHHAGIVIRNGANFDHVSELPVNEDHFLDAFNDVWLCAVHDWTPGKRLSENMRYFFEHARGDDCLIVAGTHVGQRSSDPRVFFVGNLNQIQLFGIMKRAKHFLHLAYLDDSPNVVADARAAGCRIICASSGGTHEIAGPDAVLVHDSTWDQQPYSYVNAIPMCDFQRTWLNGPERTHGVNMQDVALAYEHAFNRIALL